MISGLDKIESQISELKKENTNLTSQVKLLEVQNTLLQSNFEKVLQLNSELRKENKQLKEKIVKLETTVSKLESELEKYKVKPNEPPGSKSIFEKQTSQNPKTKPGQKEGHKGQSRLSPCEIHRHVHYEPKCCEHCGSSNLTHLKKRNKIITDLEFQVVNTQEYYYDMKCDCCGKTTKPQSIHGTSKTPFGKNVQALIAYLRSICGNTLRPAENLFRDFFKLEISDTSISNNEIRLSKESLEEYNNYLDLVKQAQFSHKDETSYPINGKLNWIWVYDSLDHVFYRLAESRGMQVVNDDFGINPQQISINDCYAAYNRFDKQQICWAHLLREAEAHSQKDNATLNEKKFFNGLKELYRKACEFVIGDPPIEKRQSERANLENDLATLMLSLKEKTDFLERMFSRLNARLAHCFLFVEVKGLPATNNQAERSLRPYVIHRKASFGSKSFAGGEAKVRLKTMYENAKRKGEQLVFALDYLFKTQEFVDIRES